MGETLEVHVRKQSILFLLTAVCAAFFATASAEAQVRVDFSTFEVSQNGSDVEVQYVISKEGWRLLGGAKAKPVIAAFFRPAKGGTEHKAEAAITERLGKLVIPAPYPDFQLMLRIRDKIPSTKRVVGMQFGTLKPSFVGFMSDEIPRGKTSGFKNTDAVRR